MNSGGYRMKLGGGVAKLANALDSKSGGRKYLKGSIPFTATKFPNERN